MATCSSLELLDADDRDFDDRVSCDDGDSEVEPARGGNDHVQRRAGERRMPMTTDLFVVQGETTGTSMSRLKMSKKARPVTLTRTSNKPTRNDRGNQRADTAVDDSASVATRSQQDKYETEIHLLRDQLEQSHRELLHSQEEREELQVAFRRLDQEIKNGYNLTERKEKEMKIAELLTKNLKVSQMLEKQLKMQESLSAANADLQTQVQRLAQQTTLLNHVLASVETKHAALVEVHSQLTAAHVTAQQHIADLQAQLLQWERKEIESSGQHGVDSDERLRICESKCTELQRKLDHKRTLLRAAQDKTSILERACETVLNEKGDLEREVAGVHDQIISMSGAMKAMEATVEASLTSGHGARSLERIKEHVRRLEAEMLAQNRLIIDLKETVNDLLSGDSAAVARSHKGSKRRFPGTTSAGTKIDLAASRVVSLTQRLRKAEESRDHKSRCLAVFLAILPPLLQQLDALQDKFHAVVESNTILSNAVDQLQSSSHDDNLQSCKPPIALAREGYVLSGPYQPELLMGFTMSRALSEVAPSPPRKHTKCTPFHVQTRGNISDHASIQDELVLAADVDDASGVAFLNRCKINAFLHFVQGSAAKAKCKRLLVQRIADLLSAHRDLMHSHSIESGYHKASVAKLEAEACQLAKKQTEMQHELEQLRNTVSVGVMHRHMKLLLKLVDAVADAPPTRGNTFLTETDGTYASDLLISGDDTACRGARYLQEIALDLSDCEIGDRDLETLLLKISVSPVRISELNLSDNRISDDGAATLAAFLDTCPRSLKILNLRGNTKISSDGVGRLKNGLLKNPRSCRVDVDATRNMLSVMAADQEFDTAGRPPILLEIHLPEQTLHPSAGVEHDQDKAIEHMLQRLESLGFSGTTSNLARAEATYRPSKLSAATVKSSTGGRPRHGSSHSKVLSAPTARVARTAQHDRKFRALEAALGRADSKATTRPSSSDNTRGISLSQMQHLLKSHASRSTIPTSSATVMSTQRLAKLHFAQSHLATIRGLTVNKK